MNVAINYKYIMILRIYIIKHLLYKSLGNTCFDFSNLCVTLRNII